MYEREKDYCKKIRRRITPTPISANATLSVRTVAETIDCCPDFYHWQANVAGALPLLTEKLLCVGVADTYVMVNLSHLF